MALASFDPSPSYAAGVRELHEVIDRFDADVAVDDLGGTLASVDRAISRLESVKLRLVAAANRAKLAEKAGYSDTAAWLARATRAGSASATRSVRLASALDTGHLATGSALGAGEVSPEHAAVIVGATEQLPAGLSRAERDTVETALVEKARTLDPVMLRRAARRALAAVTADQAAVDAHEDGLLHDEGTRALAKTRLSLFDNGDGTTSGHFTVPTLAASILQRAIHSMTAPRRCRFGASEAQAEDLAARGDWAHRAGLAFVELLEHLPTDRLHGKVAATVVITLDHERLAAAVGAAGVDTGDSVSSGDLRRLACGASILPAVLGAPSTVLDLGRSQRLFSESQRVALALLHRTCAADGCERPYSWCELHHRQPWASDGLSDLANALPLCGFHHRRIHDPAYRHREGSGGVTFHRRT